MNSFPNVVVRKGSLLLSLGSSSLPSTSFCGEVWNPTDLYKIDMPESLIEKQKEKTNNLAILINEGIISESQLVS